jgi:hypothetical protein
MQLKQTKVFVPVKEIEEHSLIQEAVSDIVTICSLNDTESAKKLISSQFLVMNNLDYEKKELYTITKEELERVIGDAFEAGELHNEYKKDIWYTKASTMYKDLKQYIKQILK